MKKYQTTTKLLKFGPVKIWHGFCCFEKTAWKNKLETCQDSWKLLNITDHCGFWTISLPFKTKWANSFSTLQALLPDIGINPDWHSSYVLSESNSIFSCFYYLMWLLILELRIKKSHFPERCPNNRCWLKSHINPNYGFL